MTRPLSGDQHVLRGHGYDARVAGVGATLRSLRHGGRDLVVPFDADELRPAMRGALLAPWPNRTGDGRYTYAGVRHQLPLTEPGLGHAAHGLAAWLGFRLVGSTGSRVVLTGTIEPQPGYPWRVRLDVEHAVGEDGLTQRVTATNESPRVAPFGVGGHPYLVAGARGRGAVDGWTLELPARTAVLTDERLLPVRAVDVAQHGVLDFRRPRRIGATVLNHAWTDLAPGPDGRTRVRVLDDTGRGAELVADARCRWVQVYTADHEDGDAWRSGLAVEPMTCPPDALRSGQDLVELEPGRPWTTGWTIRALG
ncbi:MAG: aldose 1-epimerase family protein [Micrococcales bacterium]|nr:aldose 1-epimerase family protein [Micrococcales bacterium]